MRTFTSRWLRAAAAGVLTIGGLAAAAAPAAADPGPIPPGPVGFYINGGFVEFGAIDPGTGDPAQSLPLSSNDQPPQCNDGVDNESGTYHNGSSNPAIDSVDGLIDFGATAGKETANTGCLNLSDNLELFDRRNNVPDPAPTCTTGSFGAAPYCSGDDAFTINSSASRTRGSVAFNNGNATTGQGKLDNQATGGTVTGSNVSVPNAGVQFDRGYTTQGQCVTSPITVCLNLYVEFAILPQGNITGVTNADGSGTVSTDLRLRLNISKTYDSGDPLGLVPESATCLSNANISLNLSTENANGVRYDTTAQAFRVTQQNVTVPLFSGTNYGGTAANLCDEINNALFPLSGGSPVPATNGIFELIITTQATSNTAGSADTGTGMAANPGSWRPVSVLQTDVNGAGQSSPSTGDVVINVNEGDVVEIDNGASYDPALRHLDDPSWTQTLALTGGTAGTPPAVKQTETTRTFVAQDAPAAGNTLVFTSSVSAHLGPIAAGDPGEQRQSDTSTVTVNVANVAPTADAGADQLVSGGTTVQLKGSSSDLGDPVTERTYCWTQLSGTSVGLPACSPGNGANQSFSVPNADATLQFQLQVTDDDGASGTDTVTVETRATTPGTISGYVTDSSNGSPLTFSGNNAKVDLFNGTALVATTQVQAGGYYQFTGLGAGSYTVRGRASGYEGVYNGGRAIQKFAPVLAPPSSVVDLGLMSSSGISNVFGLVDTFGGVPVNAAQVLLFDAEGSRVYKQSTASDGSFGIPEVQPGDDYTVRYLKGPAYYPRYYNNKPKVTDADPVSVSAGADTDLGTMRLPLKSADGTITGTVTDGGSPAVGIQVRAYDATTNKYERLAITDGSGNYSLDLPEGSYKLWFKDPANAANYAIWYNQLPGQPGDGTHLIADAVNVSSGATTSSIDASQ